MTSPETTPKRQGFYKVTLRDGSKRIAEWREYDKELGKTWWQHVGKKPTDEKKPVLLEGVVSFDKASQQEIDNALKRELTEAEEVQKAYEFFCSRNNLHARRVVPIPDNRKLALDDRVLLGGLEDCTVRGFFEDGQVVVLRYLHRSRDNKTNALSYGAWFWYDMVPEATSAPAPRFPTSTVFDKVRVTSRQIEGLLSWCLKGGMQDNTPYQRDYVWTDDDKDRFLDAIFEGRPLGTVAVLNRQYPKDDELVDGKQRMNCLVEFVTSQRPYRGVYWHELSRMDRYLVESRNVPVMELNEEALTESEICEIFLAINAAGVPQSEEHIAHVRQLWFRLKKAEVEAEEKARTKKARS